MFNIPLHVIGMIEGARTFLDYLLLIIKLLEKRIDAIICLYSGPIITRCRNRSQYHLLICWLQIILLLNLLGYLIVIFQQFLHRISFLFSFRLIWNDHVSRVWDEVFQTALEKQRYGLNYPCLDVIKNCFYVRVPSI